MIALSGCGSSGKDDDTTIPGGADPGTVQVIRGWADELRAGDVTAASRRFALPTVVQNGTPTLRLTTRDEIEAFNQSLPCGATLTEAVSVDRFTIATFKLTERPGPGECGIGRCLIGVVRLREARHQLIKCRMPVLSSVGKTRGQ